jgi:methylated-DNA-[protein]-cysteine S-methyltransferase
MRDGILPITYIIQGWYFMEAPIYLTMLSTDMLGLIGVAVSNNGLLRLRMFQDNKEDFLELNQTYHPGPYYFSDLETSEMIQQLRAYLNKELRKFSLPIDWTPYTDFQRAVLQETYRIPYGETRSYGEIAAAIANPKASRAVGQAEKNNQVPLIVPCHRVIGSNGNLTGYGGKNNTDLKAKILAFEQW